MLRKLTISHRSALFFSLLGAVTLILGVYSIRQITNLSDMTEEIGELRLPLVSKAAELRRDVLQLRVAAANLMTTQADQNIRTLLQEIGGIRNTLQTNFTALNVEVRASEARTILNQIIQRMDSYTGYLDQMIQYRQAGDLEAAHTMRESRLTPIGMELNSLLDDFIGFQNQQANRTVLRTQDVGAFALKSITLAIVLAISLVAMFAFLFSRSLIGPLRSVVEHSRSMAQGDFSRDMEVTGSDEATEMVVALNDMEQQIRSVLQRIMDSSHQLAATSEELHAVTGSTEATIMQQNQQLEQAATAVNELTAAINEVATHATMTSDNSEQVHEKAQLGQEKLQTTQQSIDNLVDEINRTSEGMNILAQEVIEIGSVMDIIRNIAEQTNLLALNAAIEAARAGESGRGFAVVADEVRGLAQRTQESTAEIERIIKNVQQGTEVAVKNMEQSNQWARETKSVTEELGGALGEVTLLISQINEQNLSVASATEEQATVALEVDKSLTLIRDLSTDTVSGAQQTNTSSQELAELAGYLSNLTSQFKLS